MSTLILWLLRKSRPSIVKITVVTMMVMRVVPLSTMTRFPGSPRPRLSI